jgi:hypothetical protein
MSQSGVMLFEQASSWNGSLGVRAVTPDIVHLMVKPLYQTIAFTLPITVGAIVATQRYHLDPLVTPLLFCVSFGALMTRFARFLTWNEPQYRQPDAERDEDEPEEEPAPEISTQALAWQDIQKTQGGVKLRALIVPRIDNPDKHIPVKLVQRFAIAVVNNGMEWVDERDLEGIGRTVYRSIREAWMEWGYAVKTPDRKTVLTEHGRVMTRKVAMTPPE